MAVRVRPRKGRGGEVMTDDRRRQWIDTSRIGECVAAAISMLAATTIVVLSIGAIFTGHVVAGSIALIIFTAVFLLLVNAGGRR